jgi:hypothetical protein
MDKLLRKLLGPRYVVVQRAGIMGKGRELGRFDYFSKDSALRFANMANMYTDRTYCAVEKVARD